MNYPFNSGIGPFTKVLPNFHFIIICTYWDENEKLKIETFMFYNSVLLKINACTIHLISMVFLLKQI